MKEKRVIAFALNRLTEAKCVESWSVIDFLIHDLELMAKLLNALPGYEEGDVLDVFCGKEEPDAE